METEKFLNEKIVKELIFKTSSLFYIGTTTGILASFIFVILFWLKFNLIYSFFDGLLTLFYMICLLSIFHLGIMFIVGLPVFFLGLLFKKQGKDFTSYFPELLGFLGIISYYILSPEFARFKQRGTDVSSYTIVQTLIDLIIVSLIFIGGIFSLKRIRRFSIRKLSYKSFIISVIFVVSGILLINWLFPDTYKFSNHYPSSFPLESKANHSVSTSQIKEHPVKNIVLITYDALRPDHLSFFGYKRLTSPFLDQIMAQSACFSNVTAAYPQTSQSFASLFTGNYPWYTMVWQPGQVLSDRLETVAEELSNQGYHTYAVITNYNLFPAFNFNQGFEKYFPCEKSDPISVTDAAIKLIDKGLEDPFFLWVHYLDPHSPYNPPESYVELFKGDSQYFQDLNPAQYMKNESDWTPSAEEVAEKLACYDGEIRFQDDQFKRLFYFLKDEGYLDNSVLVFTSDHGEYFGHHGYYFNHGPSPYRELQVPLFWYCPQLISPKRSDHPVELVDVVPTMLSIVDLTPKKMELVGIDLSDFITKEDGLARFPRPYAMGIAYVTDQRGFPQFFILRSKEFELIVNKLDHLKRIKSMDRLIEFSNAFWHLKGQGTELYDIVNDPFEKENMVLMKPQVKDSMLGALGERLIKYAKPNRDIQVPLKKLDKESREKLKSLGYLK